MKSNSKLTKFQKRCLLTLEDQLETSGGFTFYHAGVTLAIVPEFNGSKMVNVAVSIMSSGEKRERESVGRYTALCRWLDNETIKIPKLTNFYRLCETLAENND